MTSLYELSMPLFETRQVQQVLREASAAVEAVKPPPEATFHGE